MSDSKHSIHISLGSTKITEGTCEKYLDVSGDFVHRKGSMSVINLNWQLTGLGGRLPFRCAEFDLALAWVINSISKLKMFGSVEFDMPNIKNFKDGKFTQDVILMASAKYKVKLTFSCAKDVISLTGFELNWADGI